MIPRSMFIDRVEELNLLKDIANSKRPELVIVYGRRRIGKTRLLIEFKKQINKKTLYLMADLSENLLDILARQINESFVRFQDWEDFYEFLYKSDYDIIIIDEFQYLYKVNKAFPSQFQRWREKIKERNKKIIFCGSIISTIYKISVGYGSPLYGRKTHEIKINPLKFKYIFEFFPEKDIEDIIKIYSVLGGVPRYLEEFEPAMDLWENLKNYVLRPSSFLYNEPMNIFFEEFKNPAPYLSILLAISQGYKTFNKISTYSRIPVNKLTKYLMVLERLEIIEKEVPVTINRLKSRFTIYKIKDNFFNFWFKFVYPNKLLLEQGQYNIVLNKIKNDFNQYLGKVFEDVCKEALLELRPISFNKIGKYWDKNVEIDLLGLNEDSKELLGIECKWKDNIDPKKICKSLIDKLEYIDWNKNQRREYLAIFAKGFKEKINEFEEHRVFCYDLKDIENFIRKQK